VIVGLCMVVLLPSRPLTQTNMLSLYYNSNFVVNKLYVPVIKS